MVGDRGAVRGGVPAGDHRGDLPDHPDPSGDHRSGRGHGRGPARRSLRVGCRQRRGAQRARPGRPVAVGRGAPGDARGSRAGDPPAAPWRRGELPRPPLRGAGRPHLHPSRAAGTDLCLRIRAAGHRAGGPHRRRVLHRPPPDAEAVPRLPRRRWRVAAGAGRDEGVLRRHRGRGPRYGASTLGRTTCCRASSPRSCRGRAISRPPPRWSSGMRSARRSPAGRTRSGTSTRPRSTSTPASTRCTSSRSMAGTTGSSSCGRTRCCRHWGRGDQTDRDHPGVAMGAAGTPGSWEHLGGAWPVAWWPEPPERRHRTP